MIMAMFVGSFVILFMEYLGGEMKTMIADQDPNFEMPTLFGDEIMN
jgi:hypothetical protein